MTRKRFKKLLMSDGFSRNEADLLIRAITNLRFVFELKNRRNKHED